MTRSVYDEEFYLNQIEGSVGSAKIIVPILMDAVDPGSVVDIGCGAGGWLAEFERSGVEKVLGIDGSVYAEKTNRLRSDQFRQADLTASFNVGARFDLALSLEVAEHLPESRARSFVKDLTLCAEAVFFSAAIPHQGGIEHINENWQSYWAQIFEEFGYYPLDIVRPIIWNYNNVQWWYAQNAILYVSESSIRDKYSLRYGSAVENKFALDVVHPRKYLLDADPDSISFHRALSLVANSLKRKLKKLMP